MTAQEQSQSKKLKPRWRVRRSILSLLVACSIAAGLLWSTLLFPRTFQAIGIWSGNPDPLLAQIDHPPLHQLAEEILKQHSVATPSITITPITTPPGVQVTAKAPSAQLAIDRVDEWLAQRAAHLTEQLATQLSLLSQQHESQITAMLSQRNEITSQLHAAQSLITDTSLQTHEQLAVQLSDTQQQLEQLTRQQAVYLGANRTLKGLLSRKQLLEQDLAMHQNQYGRGNDDPAVQLVKDQLEKLNVRINVISEASKLDTDADSKLAKVSAEIDVLKQTITLLRGKQQQLVEQAQATELIAKLSPQSQALERQLGYHRQQLALVDQVLNGHVAWGHIQQATAQQTTVIWPTLPHILLLTLSGALMSWIMMQLVLRLFDRTLDHGMPIAQSLDMPILGFVTFERQVSLLSRLCRMTIYPLATAMVVMVLCVSLAVAYMNVQQPHASTILLKLIASPQQLGQIWKLSPQRHVLPPRALPVVIQLQKRDENQLSNKSTNRI